MKPEATVNKLRRGVPCTWVALGDSLTYGWMVKKGCFDFLAEMLRLQYPAAKVDFCNRGVPGDTAEGGLHRLSDHVLPLSPDIVSVQFALNDMFIGYAPGQFGRNMEAIVHRLRQETAADIILMTSVALADPHENARAEGFYRIIVDIAAREQLPCAQVHAYWQRTIEAGCCWETLVQQDGVRPTEAGCRLMAEAIMEVL